MIHTDDKPTIVGTRGAAVAQDEHWLTLLERDLMQLDRLERERVYAACRELATSTFEWLACLAMSPLDRGLVHPPTKGEGRNLVT
jgi:hypothetical protein